MIHPGITGEDLVRWRAKQPGEFPVKNGATKRGWSQERAAKWYGCSVRQWQRYESGESEVPLPLVRRIQAYSADFSEMLDRIFETPVEKVREWGSPHEELAHEKRT